MTARGEAEKRLSLVHRNPDVGQSAGLKGIGWALLDLADAVRESKPRPPSMAELDEERRRANTLNLEALRDHLGRAVEANGVWCCPCGQVLANTREDAYDRMVAHIEHVLTH